MTALFKWKPIIIGLFGAIIIWSVWGVLSEIGMFIANIWAWRPAVVVGAAMIVGPIALAFPIDYFLNVRRRSIGGVVGAASATDYIGYVSATVFVRIVAYALIMGGIFILLFGFGPY